MAFNTKGITIEINGDASGFEKALRQVKAEVQGIDREMSKLTSAMKKSGTSTQLFGKYQDLLHSKIGNVNKQLATHKQALAATQEEYRRSVEATGEFSKKSVAAKQHIDTLESEIAILESTLKTLSGQFLNCSSNMKNMYVHLGNIADMAGKAYEKLKPISMLSFAAIAGATKTAISFEDAWTGVTKTVEGTPSQMEALNEGLKELALNTASSYEDLAGFAEMAGQMGVATENVLDFTTTIAMLGDTTNLAGESAAQGLAKIGNIMAENGSLGVDYYQRMGSTIVDLGNHFATTENDIVEMSKKLAVAGKAVGFSTADVLALSTALSSMGIEASAGGGSISKLLKQIDVAVNTNSESLQKYAEVSGMSAEEFSKAWGEDAAGAFAKFVEGIGKSENISKTLQDLDIKEIRMSNAVGALAQNTSVLNNALSMSDSAWQSNSAMVEEAKKRYETTKTALLQAKEAIKQAGASLAVGFAPALKDLAVGVKDVASAFANMDESTRNFIAKSLVLGAALAPVAKVTQKVAKGGQVLIKAWAGANGVAGALASKMGLLEKAGGESAVSFASLTKAMVTSTVEAGGFAGKMLTVVGAIGKASLVTGAAVGAVRLLGLAYEKYQEHIYNAAIEKRKQGDIEYKIDQQILDSTRAVIEASQKREESIQQTKQGYQEQADKAEVLTSSIGALIEKENLSAIEKKQLAAQIEALNELFPGLNLSYDENSGKVTDNTGKVIDNTKALKDNVQAFLEAAKAKAYQEALTETQKDLIEVNRGFSESSQELNKHAGSLGKASEQLQDYNKALNDGRATEFHNAMSKLNRELNSGRISQKEYNKSLDELNKKYPFAAKGAGNLEEANKKLKEAFNTESDAVKKSIKNMQDCSKQMQEAKKDILSLQNERETGGMSQMGESVKKELDSVIESAKQAGVEIPQNIADGIANGTITVQEAIELIANYTTFQSMVSNAGLTGAQIPQFLSQGILSGSISVAEASQYISELLTWQGKVAEAQAQGMEIPTNLALGMIANAGSVAEAINFLNTFLTWMEACNDAGVDGQAIAQALANGISSGAYTLADVANAMGKDIDNGVQSGVDGAAANLAGGKISSAAKSEGSSASSGFKANLKLKPAVSDENSAASRLLRGSSVPGSAGTMGSRATSSFAGSFRLSSIVSSQVNSAKRMIQEVLDMASRPINLSVVKHVTTKEESGGKKAPARMAMAATPSATPMARAAQAVSYSERNILSTQDTISAVSASQSKVMQNMSDRLLNLEGTMRSLVNRLDLEGIEKSLAVIERNSDKTIVMSNRKVGQLTAKSVNSEINKSKALQARLKGAV